MVEERTLLPRPGRRMVNCWWSLLAVAIVAVGLSAAADERSLPVDHRGERAAESVPAARCIGLAIGPGTTVIDGPLTAEGLPDYAAHLNAALSQGISPEENFWGAMWSVFGQDPRLPASELAAYEQWLKVSIPVQGAFVPASFNPSDFRRVTQAPWTADNFPKIAASIERNEEALDLVEQAARRPLAFAPLDSAAEGPLPPSFARLTHLERIAPIVRLLTARAMLRLEGGDADGAWRDLMTCYRIARHVESGWRRDDLWTAWWIRDLAAEGVVQWIAHVDQPLVELAWRFGELRPLLHTRSATEVLDSERLCFADLILGSATGRVRIETLVGLGWVDGRPRREPDASPFGQIKAELSYFENTVLTAEALRFHGKSVNAALDEGGRNYAELKEALSLGTHAERRERLKTLMGRLDQESERLGEPGAFWTEALFSSSDSVARLTARHLLGRLIRNVPSLEIVQTRSETQSRLLLVAMAIKETLAAGGPLPVDWESVAMEPAARIDPFTGEPFRMQTTSRGVTISSLGPNGKEDFDPYQPQANIDDIRMVLWRK